MAVAVVTGASNGLGRALSAEFTRRGIAVVGFGRSSPDLEITAQLADSALFTPMVVDVSDPEAVAHAFDELGNLIGPPDILINNAAVHPRIDIAQETAEDFMRCVSINLGGAVNCSYAALRTMIQSGSGRIINVGSFADQAPLSGAGAYSVSKARFASSRTRLSRIWGSLSRDRGHDLDARNSRNENGPTGRT